MKHRWAALAVAVLALSAFVPRDSAAQTGGHFAGWFSFQPLWQEICRTDPDLFE